MASSLYRAWTVPLRIGLLAWGLTTGLASTPAVAGGGQRKALVLSVTEENRQSEVLRAALGEMVERTGAQLVVPASLSASARSCDDPRCLTTLSKEHGVEVIIAGRVSRQSRLERLVDVWAFELSSRRDASERDLCDFRDIKDCLTELGARVLGKLSSPVTPAPTSERGPTVGTASQAPATAGSPPGQSRPPAQVGTVPPRGMPTPLPTWRVGLGSGLVALAAVGLGIGIGASLKHGKDGPPQCPAGTRTDCRYDMIPLLVPAYAVAAAATVAATLTFTLPTRRVLRKESSR
ncbi:MAG: hypothetical protein JNJ46_33350 [Myxococcales bacterium]|nr:hypothetical protein [Myxococcales bacterium]